MKQLQHIAIRVLILGLPVLGLAQQLPQFSQYMYNTISVNPAYAGSREVLVVNLLNRNQWLGIDGAPVTQTLSAHSSIPGTKLGVGLSVINDKLGYEKTTYLSTAVSYTIDLDPYDEYKLAFGVQGGFRRYTIDDELLMDPNAANDPFLQNLDPSWNPNVGAGLYFRGDSFYVGVSAPKLLSYGTTSEYADLDKVSYFLNGGYLFDVNPHLKFKPSFLIKYVNGAPISFDFSSMFYINENLWLGGMYRYSDSFGAIVNFRITEGLSIGYAYDYITSNLSVGTSGSHELMLNYEFEFPKPRCKCKDLYN
ncbi:MAG: type IX secretion system membrane protein PorP/SprF [Altibacter sp.]|nr:type IX secretion system membrane protein PorP/SprF [Altibacter sp.]